MRPPIKKRMNGPLMIQGLGRAVGGMFTGRMMERHFDTPEYEALENDMAKLHGQQSYYRGSPSSSETKAKVAKKMGAR